MQIKVYKCETKFNRENHGVRVLIMVKGLVILVFYGTSKSQKVQKLGFTVVKYGLLSIN